MLPTSNFANCVYTPLKNKKQKKNQQQQNTKGS